MGKMSFFGFQIPLGVVISLEQCRVALRYTSFLCRAQTSAKDKGAVGEVKVGRDVLF